MNRIMFLPLMEGLCLDMPFEARTTCAEFLDAFWAISNFEQQDTGFLKSSVSYRLYSSVSSALPQTTILMGVNVSWGKTNQSRQIL